MTNRTETLAQDLKAWAADQLHVPPDCAPAQVRAAFLRQVQLDNGVLNLAAREAMLILTGRTHAARPALALEAAEAKLQREVDDFAARFFSMSVTERKSEWNRLRARGPGFVRVDARLTALAAGLEIVLPSFERNTQVQQLVSIVGELFVLRPAARAARRQAFLEEAKRSGTRAGCAEAAARLQANHAAIAALEPVLIAELTESDTRADYKRELNRSMAKAAEPAPASKSGNWWIWLVLFAGISGAVRLFTGGGPAPQPQFNPNPRNVPDFNAQPKFDMNDILKNMKLKKAKDGKEWEPDGDPGAVERLLGKDAARRLLEQAKDKPDVPKDKNKRDVP